MNIVIVCLKESIAVILLQFCNQSWFTFTQWAVYVLLFIFLFIVKVYKHRLSVSIPGSFLLFLVFMSCDLNIQLKTLTIFEMHSVLFNIWILLWHQDDKKSILLQITIWFWNVFIKRMEITKRKVLQLGFLTAK